MDSLATLNTHRQTDTHTHTHTHTPGTETLEVPPEVKPTTIAIDPGKRPQRKIASDVARDRLCCHKHPDGCTTPSKRSTEVFRQICKSLKPAAFAWWQSPLRFCGGYGSFFSRSVGCPCSRGCTWRSHHGASQRRACASLCLESCAHLVGTRLGHVGGLELWSVACKWMTQRRRWWTHTWMCCLS